MAVGLVVFFVALYALYWLLRLGERVDVRRLARDSASGVADGGRRGATSGEESQ